MSDSLDPKELKVLSDILALVLEDQPGQSENALAAIRNRAARNKVTGGALKNLFVAIAPSPPPRAAAAARPRATRASAASTQEIQRAHQNVRELTESLNKLDLELRAARASNAALRSELFVTQQARAESQTELSRFQSVSQRRLPVIILAFVVGCVAGVAGTELFHAMLPQPHHIPNAVYLQ